MLFSMRFGIRPFSGCILASTIVMIGTIKVNANENSLDNILTLDFVVYSRTIITNEFKVFQNHVTSLLS